MRSWLPAVWFAVLAMVPGATNAAGADTREGPETSLTFSLGGAETFQLHVRPNPDPSSFGSEISIDCDECALHYRKPMEGLWPQGVFVLGEHDGGHNANIATLWMSASREVVIVYNITPKGVQIVMEGIMNALPTFTADASGREQVVVPGYVDVGRQKTHPETVTVYTWDGSKFVSRERPWSSFTAR
jgi:hypothetical protein